MVSGSREKQREGLTRDKSRRCCSCMLDIGAALRALISGRLRMAYHSDNWKSDCFPYHIGCKIPINDVAHHP